MAGIIDNISEMIRLFTDVAFNSGNPGSIVLLVMGTVFVAAAVVVLGYLVLGAFGSLLIPDTGGRAPPQGRH